MLTKRIIPCLDCDLSVPEGRVVKGKQFQNIVYAGVPHELAQRYYAEGADEIVFLDITASHEGRETMTHVIEKTVENVFVPITVGGGIHTVARARDVFLAGADKIAVNTAALRNPSLIRDLADHFGTQAVVVAIDCKRTFSPGGEVYFLDENTGKRFWFECYTYGGRTPTGIDAISWAVRAESLGAGELLVTSIDRDGTRDGYDILLTRTIAERTGIPVIASGGAGSVEHIREALTEGKANAALLAGLLHFEILTIPHIKQTLHPFVPLRV